MDDLVKGRLKILFVSPERLSSAAFRRLLRPKYNSTSKSYERLLPTVSLFCVDEAHCVSQWGHNFRPSYLRLKSLLTLLKPQSLLALTATACPVVIRDICKTLSISESFNQSESNDVLRNHVDEVKDIQERIGNFDEQEGDNTFSKTEFFESVKVLDISRDNIDVMSVFLDCDSKRRKMVSE